MGTKEKMSKFEPLYLHLDSAPAFAGARQALSSLPRKQHGPFREWLSGVDAYTLHKPVVRKFTRRPTIVSGLGEQVQADLMDVSARSADNGGINFLLVVIDVFSKKVWVEPLERKTGKLVSEALFRVLRGKNYRFVQTDKGREFYNPQVSGVMEKLDAHHFSTENENLKAAVVERVNKTLRGKIQRYLTHANTNRYIDALPGLVRGYNNTRHASTGVTPNEVSYENQEDIWLRMYEKDGASLRRPQPKLDVGDSVRLANAARSFERGYEKRWTEEIFTVSRVWADGTPPLYSVTDQSGETLAGRFYERELQKVRLPDAFRIERVLRRSGSGKNARLFVKWFGYPETFNSWISADQVI